MPQMKSGTVCALVNLQIAGKTCYYKSLALLFRQERKFSAEDFKSTLVAIFRNAVESRHNICDDKKVAARANERKTNIDYEYQHQIDSAADFNRSCRDVSCQLSFASPARICS
jgi:hypothetical protein